MFITAHARLRFAERFPELIFEDELKSSHSFGAQKGDGHFLLSQNNVVFVIKNNSVITALTKDYAITNMQSQFKNLVFDVKPNNTPAMQDVSPQIARELGRAHAAEYVKLTVNKMRLDGMSKKRRNAVLKENGIDPGSKSGNVYRDEYHAEIARLLKVHRSQQTAT